ncbi:hypothetical protein LPJ70_005917, partial [Coemansia sp. RSA 2708]
MSTHVFRLQTSDDAETVELLGTFGSKHWEPIATTKVDGGYEAHVVVEPNVTYAYKFRVDGQWVLDTLADTATDDAGLVNNVFTLKSADQLDEKIQSADSDEDAPVVVTDASLAELKQQQQTSELDVEQAAAAEEPLAVDEAAEATAPPTAEVAAPAEVANTDETPIVVEEP